jgi:hypothetical protein
MMAIDHALPLDAPPPVSDAAPLGSDAARKTERRFFTGMAIAASIVIFAGFGRTYYLKSFTNAAALTPLVHVHAAVFTAWVLLFIVQVRLVAGRRLALHRRLGVATVVLSAVMIVLGVLTVIAGARRGATVPGFTSREFMLIPLTDLVIFTIAVTLAVLHRRKRAVHKRLMLLALIGGLLLPAISRLPWVHEHPPVIPLVFVLFLGAAAVFDRRTLGRLHWVNAWGAAAVFLTVPLRLVLSRTSGWNSVASWLIQ